MTNPVETIFKKLAMDANTLMEFIIDGSITISFKSKRLKSITVEIDKPKYTVEQFSVLAGHVEGMEKSLRDIGVKAKVFIPWKLRP